MPLFVPKGLPAVEKLAEHGITLYTDVPAGVRTLKILLLNLMPVKEVTENDIARQLSKTALPVELILVKVRGHKYKNTSEEHMERFCALWNALNTLPEIQGRRVDACIIEGKSYREVAEAEGVHKSSVQESVRSGLENMRKYLKKVW